MSKYFTFFVILALLLAGVITYQLSKDPSRLLPLKEEPPAGMESFDFQDWHLYKAPNGKFTVLLPTLPQNATENIKDQNTGENRKYDMYVSEKQDGTIFMINLITFEKQIAENEKETLMRTMMNDMMESNPNNELRSVQVQKYKGFDALDFSFGNPEMVIDAKTFIVNDTLYVITRIAKEGNQQESEFKYFINSFEFPETQKKE
jgi:hypothetical protein